MIKVILIGRGNISHHLAKAFQSVDEVELIAVLNGRKEPDVEVLERADICILAVSDRAIGEVASKFAVGRHLLAHTSGSIPLDTITSGRRAVFYPLQTFSKGREVDFSEIPICIEADKEEDAQLLGELARYISKNVQYISSDQRKQLHLAAIFANNFTNHLYQTADEICKKHDLPFALLKPLIFETAHKIGALTPYQAQTGPARRYDVQTIHTHLEMFEDRRQKKIYALLSDSIKKTYGKKL